jgi:hypothetical protein
MDQLLPDYKGKIRLFGKPQKKAEEGVNRIDKKTQKQKQEKQRKEEQKHQQQANGEDDASEDGPHSRSAENRELQTAIITMLRDSRTRYGGVIEVKDKKRALFTALQRVSGGAESGDGGAPAVVNKVVEMLTKAMLELINDPRYAKRGEQQRKPAEAKQLLLKIISKYDRRQSQMRELAEVENMRAPPEEPVEDVSRVVLACID